MIRDLACVRHDTWREKARKGRGNQSKRRGREKGKRNGRRERSEREE